MEKRKVLWAGILLIIGVFFLVQPASTIPPSPKTVHTKEDLTGQGIPNPCTGEWLWVVSGFVNVTVTEFDTKSGNSLYKEILSTQNVTLIGDDSGRLYRGALVTQQIEQEMSSGYPVVFINTQTARVVAVGEPLEDDDLFLTMVFRVVYNANGELVVDIVDSETKCDQTPVP